MVWEAKRDHCVNCSVCSSLLNWLGIFRACALLLGLRSPAGPFGDSRFAHHSIGLASAKLGAKSLEGVCLEPVRNFRRHLSGCRLQQSRCHYFSVSSIVTGGSHSALQSWRSLSYPQQFHSDQKEHYHRGSSYLITYFACIRHFSTFELSATDKLSSSIILFCRFASW